MVVIKDHSNDTVIHVLDKRDTFLANLRYPLPLASFGDTNKDIRLGGAVGQIWLKSSIYIKLFVNRMFKLHSILVLSSYGLGMLLIFSRCFLALFWTFN